MNQYRCDNKCNLFEDKPGQLQPPKEQEGDWIGWCHLRSGNLLVLRSTYDLICYFGCASHSDFQSERDKVLNNKLASRYKALLVQCMDTIEDIRRKYTIATKSCKSCSAYDLCEELRQAGSP